MTQPTGPTLAETTEIATRVMYELLGRRWVWPEVTTTETVDLEPWPNVITLHGRPVIEVHSVIQVLADGSVRDQPFQLENGHRIRLTHYTQIDTSTILVGGDMHQWLTQHSLIDPRQMSHLYAAIPPRTIAVTYTYGSPPPTEVRLAITAFAKELLLAYSGDDECRLPSRVTSITRQGVTMQMAPATSFLEEGFTGIPEVDQTIRNFNPSKAKRPARVYSPTSPPPRRTNSSQAPG